MALARRVRAALRRLVYGGALPRASLKEIAEVRKRMELELGKETRGRFHVKYGRGGLVDVEFLAQALQLDSLQAWNRGDDVLGVGAGQFGNRVFRRRRRL